MTKLVVSTAQFTDEEWPCLLDSIKIAMEAAETRLEEGGESACVSWREGFIVGYIEAIRRLPGD